MRGGSGSQRAEEHRLEVRPARESLSFGVPTTDDALGRDLEVVAEARLGKALAPDRLPALREPIRGSHRASRASHPCRLPLQVGGADETPRDVFERGAAKTAKSRLAQREPAAAACPPKRRSRSGWRFATRSSASRRCRPRIERPEPLISPAFPRAKAITGRWNRSFSRDATMPITPWCHSGLKGRSRTRLPRSRVASERARIPACRLRSRGARG